MSLNEILVPEKEGIPKDSVLITRKDGEKVIAYVELVIFRSAHSRDPIAYAHDMFTAPEHRGKGIAKALMIEAANYAKEKGCYKLFCVCAKDSVAFKVHTGNGLVERGVHMQILLKEPI